jgi:hypothetical protein
VTFAEFAGGTNKNAMIRAAGSIHIRKVFVGSAIATTPLINKSMSLSNDCTKLLYKRIFSGVPFAESVRSAQAPYAVSIPFCYSAILKIAELEKHSAGILYDVLVIKTLSAGSIKSLSTV